MKSAKSAKRRAGPVFESDEEVDMRETLRIASFLLRDCSELDSLTAPGGDDALPGTVWMAELIARVAELPVGDLRRLAGLTPHGRGRPAVKSRIADALALGAKLAAQNTLKGRGDASEEAAGRLRIDRRTLQRRVARAKSQRRKP